jgi:ATP-dependent RNA helicase DHX29
LIPEYVSAKAKHLELTRGLRPSENDADLQMEIAKLEAKIRKIENDVLFDKFSADLKWKSERIVIEKQLAVAKKEAQAAADEAKPKAEPSPEVKAEGDINDEAERIAAEILSQQEDDDDDIAGLFASLPQNEVDPNTGKSQTVVNSADGTKLILRDFGKWTGVSPRRVLEESCRSR